MMADIWKQVGTWQRLNMSQKTRESCLAQFFRVDAEMLSGPAAFLTVCLAKRILTSDG